MRIGHLLIAGALLSGSLIARADTYSTYNLTSSYNYGGTIDGTLTLDTTTNLFSAADLTVAGFVPTFNDGTLSNVGLQGEIAGVYGVNVFSLFNPSASLNLFLPVSSLAGLSGSPILGLSDVTFDFGFGGIYFAGTGSLEPAASVTPEPTSLLLLATGLLGLAAFWRRRFAL
ncbi:MAG: PEP-CTERM sorting domain-containing protein [Acidobacteriaceae bacterium]